MLTCTPARTGHKSNKQKKWRHYIADIFERENQAFEMKVNTWLADLEFYWEISVSKDFSCIRKQDFYQCTIFRVNFHLLNEFRAKPEYMPGSYIQAILIARQQQIKTKFIMCLICLKNSLKIL